MATVDEEVSLPKIDLSATNETAEIRDYGRLVTADLPPTNELSWRMTRRSVRPMKPVPTPLPS